MNHFVTFISDHLDIISASIWSKLCARLVLPVSPLSENPRCVVQIDYTAKNCPFNVNSPLEGIIDYLRNKCGGNVRDLSVAISASSVRSNDASDAVANIAAGGSGNWFFSQSASGQWVCYDFRDSRVTLTHYAIQSCDGGTGPNWDNPKNWCLEGSQDGTSWTELDRRENNTELDKCSKVVSFSVSCSTKVRLIRLRQIGVNCAGSQEFVFSRLELFGTFFETTQ
jgi:hypothetical protein